MAKGFVSTRGWTLTLMAAGSIAAVVVGCKAVSEKPTIAKGAYYDSPEFCAVDGGFVQVSVENGNTGVHVALVPKGGNVGTFYYLDKDGSVRFPGTLGAGKCARVRVENKGSNSYTGQVTVAFDFTAGPTTKPVPVTTNPPPPPPPPGNVPCALNIGARACWAANTGVPGWSEADILAGKSPLKHSVGDRTITQDGTVIDGEWIDGCLAIKADNVTVKNSFIRTTHACWGGDGTASGSAINTGGCHDLGASITNFVIQDSILDAGNVGPGYSYVGLGTCNYTARRLNAHGGHMTLWVGSNVTLENSFIHDPTNAASPNHTESIDADSGDHNSLIHNWISAETTPQTDWQTGALSVNNSWGPATYFVIKDNFIEGANGTDVNFGGGTTSARPWGDAQYITFTGNRLSPHTAWGNQFFYGWVSSNPGMVWSDNKQSENLAPLNP